MIVKAKIKRKEITLKQESYEKISKYSPCDYCVMNQLIRRNSPFDCMKYVPDCRAHMNEDRKVKIYKRAKEEQQ